MTYATQADLVLRFGETEIIQITDRFAAAGAIDAAVVERALLDADAEIDGYLAARYALPLASVPRLLLGLACDIARYRLFDDRATDQVTRRYDDAVKMLQRLAKGELALGLSTTNEPAQTPAGGAQGESAERVFSRTLLGDYAP